MADYNKANRQVCDVDIRVLSTKKPFLKFKTANTTTAGISGDSVYARAKGSRRIPFANPIEGTMSIEAQVYPFKLFSLFSDGTIKHEAVYADTQIVTATAAGSLAVSVVGGYVQAGTVFVYPVGEFGNEEQMIAGTYSNGTFTASVAATITVGAKYEVGYIVKQSAGVKKVTLNNSQLQQDYYITMRTADKDENGIWTPFLMTAYKASPKRSFDLSFSSEGDPATVKLDFDLMEDADGNVFDMVELEEVSTIFSVSTTSVALVKGTTSQSIAITGTEGLTSLTATVKDSSNETYSKIHAILSANKDTLIISADSDAANGNYTVQLDYEYTSTDNASEFGIAIIRVSISDYII